MSYLNSTPFNIVYALRSIAPSILRESWTGAVEIEDSTNLSMSVRDCSKVPTIYVPSSLKEEFEAILFKHEAKFIGTILIEGEYKDTDNVHVYEINTFLNKLEGHDQLQAKKLDINTLNVSYDYVPSTLKAMNFSDRIHWLLDHGLLSKQLVQALADGNSNSEHFVLQQRLQKIIVSNSKTKYFKLNDYNIKNLITLDPEVVGYRLSQFSNFMGAIDKHRVILNPGDGLIVTTKVVPRAVGLFNHRLRCVSSYRFDWLNDSDVAEGLQVEPTDRHVYETDTTIEDYYHAALADLVRIGLLEELKEQNYEVPEFSKFVLYYSRSNTGYSNYINGKVSDMKLIATIPYKDLALIPGVKVSGKHLKVYVADTHFDTQKIVVINEDSSFDIIQAFKDWLNPLGYAFNETPTHCMGYGGNATSVNITSGFNPLFSTDFIDNDYIVIDEEPAKKQTIVDHNCI